MRVTTRILALSIFMAGLWAVGTADAATKVVKRPVAFEVANVNRSLVRCPSDGAVHQVKGLLVSPAAAAPGAGGSDSATLYLHGLSIDRSFWSLGTVPRYDYAAALARAGHTSVVIDRLGYGESDRPGGNQTCLGADADVAHQIIGKLRTGDYATAGGDAPRFEKVALAGHGVGALIAHLEAFSFGDIDGLVAMSYTPQVRPRAFELFYASRIVCDAGGEPAREGGPGLYGYFGQTAAEFDELFFHSAEPAARDAAAALRARDPCGAGGSIIDALVQDLKSLPRVGVPVLVVCGEEDSMTPSFACPHLKRRYTGSPDVSLRIVRNAGHALPLERAAPGFRRRVSTWLKGRGL